MTIESLFKPDYVVNYSPANSSVTGGGWIDVAQIRMINFHVVIKNAATSGNIVTVVGTNHRPPLSGNYYTFGGLNQDFVTLTSKNITLADDTFCFEVVSAMQFLNFILETGTNPANFSISVLLSGK